MSCCVKFIYYRSYSFVLTLIIVAETVAATITTRPTAEVHLSGPYAGRGRRGRLAPPPPARKFSQKKVVFPHFLGFRPPSGLGLAPPLIFPPIYPQKSFQKIFRLSPARGLRTGLSITSFKLVLANQKCFYGTIIGKFNVH